jgi:hypothetical protein
MDFWDYLYWLSLAFLSLMWLRAERECNRERRLRLQVMSVALGQIEESITKSLEVRQ